MREEMERNREESREREQQSECIMRKKISYQKKKQCISHYLSPSQIHQFYSFLSSALTPFL